MARKITERTIEVAKEAWQMVMDRINDLERNAEDVGNDAYTAMFKMKFFIELVESVIINGKAMEFSNTDEAKDFIERMGQEETKVKMPRMWEVYNEKLNLFIHQTFKMVVRFKENGGIEEKQPRVTKIENGYVYEETFVHITSIEDRGEYWYIGHRPTGRHKGSYGFGFTRLYKNEVHEYGTIAFIPVKASEAR